MYKRNQKLRNVQKQANKVRILTAFMLKSCIGVKYDADGRLKVHHAISLALNHFIRLGETN